MSPAKKEESVTTVSGEGNVETPSFSKSAMTVLVKRYLKKNEKGEAIETPEDMFLRVASNIAQADRLYNPDVDLNEVIGDFYTIMVSRYFLPNSPTLMNAGRDLQQLSACFVLPVEDSMESIFTAIKNQALIHKSGGGTGFSFSKLRPKSDRVATTGGVASGPISFMKVFNAATEVVKQGGTRRGANMAILRVDHPDIVEFITAKIDNETLTNFNLSVGITEEFMRAVEENREYELLNPRTREAVRKIKAREVFDLLVEMAWLSGEPGIVFLDRINADNPTPQLGEIESTNPCGEQPLLPMESCNLGSINLSLMVKEEKGKWIVDYDKLGSVVKSAVHFLDNVIDMNRYPLPEIEKMTKSNRKIGLGVMGFADLLMRLRVPYNSVEALRIAESVMKHIRKAAEDMSKDLAVRRGVFVNFPGSIHDQRGSAPLRNATLTTIAPTGTLSIIAGSSSGIEPVFALALRREILDGTSLVEVHTLFEEEAKKKGFHSPQLMEKVARSASLKELSEIPEEIRRIYVTSHDISPEWHVRMQAAFQRYTDNAVSKTVNFSKEASREDVRKAFMLAYREGCKGITIYRYGSRGKQVLNLLEDRGSESVITSITDSYGGGSLLSSPLRPTPKAHTKITPRPRPEVTKGFTEKTGIGCGNIYVTVNADSIGLCEVFTQTGKGGGCSSQSEAVGRLVSLALRCGVDPLSIIHQMKGIRCLSCTKRQGVGVLSCPDAIAKTIEKAMQLNGFGPKAEHHAHPDDRKSKPGNGKPKNPESVLCPECRKPVDFAEGCVVCRNCGYSKCG